MSATQETVAPFQALEEQVKQHLAEALDLTPAQVAKLGSLAPAKNIGVSQNVQIQVQNGKGTYSDSVYTAGVSIKGTGKITAPSNGTWTVSVYINNNLVVQQSNVAANQAVAIPCTSTNFWSKTPFRVELVWSTGGNTTATVQVDGGTC